MTKYLEVRLVAIFITYLHTELDGKGCQIMVDENILTSGNIIKIKIVIINILYTYNKMASGH